MQRQWILGLILCFVATLVIGSDVIDLNDSNFNELVLKSELPFMVEFFAPWCGHCKALAPEWEKVATNLKDLLPVGKVDCTVHQHLCGKYDVKGYPTIKCFSEKGKKVTDYQQARQAAAIVRFATDQIPDRIERIKDSANLDKFLEKHPSHPHVLLFSAKTEVSPLIKSLAVKFGSKLSIGQVKKGVKELEEKYEVQSYPTIISVSGETKQVYDGAISSEALGAWFSGLVGDMPEFEAQQESEQAKPKPQPKPKTVAALTEIQPDAIVEACTSNLCVVGVVDADGEGETREIKSEQKSILDKVLKKWKSDKFKFVWIDRSKASDVITKFSLPTNGPSLFVFNGKRSKYAVSETFDESTSHRLLEHVNTGDVKYKQL